MTTGDDSVFERQEFTDADAKFDDFMLANCGFEEVEVTAVDFAFEGVPGAVPAGPLAVTFTNQGAEMHELALVRAATKWRGHPTPLPRGCLPSSPSSK